MKIEYKQLKKFLETTSTSLDLTDFSKCIAYLYDENGGEVASIDFINSKDVCENFIWIDEDKYTLSEKQQEAVLNHLEKETHDDLQTWKEMKEDVYDPREHGLYGYGY